MASCLIRKKSYSYISLLKAITFLAFSVAVQIKELLKPESAANIATEVALQLEKDC